MRQSSYTLGQALAQNFLGQSPNWYKLTIVGFLILNPVLLIVAGPYVAGWVLLLEFIFTLALALRCYPLQPGGLLAIQAVVIGLTDSGAVYREAINNFQVILLLIFMVAGVFFLKDLLLFTFTKILLKIRSKTALSVMFSLTAAVLSAFLDALTVMAVVITVASGFYGVYHKVASGKQFDHDHDAGTDDLVQELHRSDLERFRAFLRSLVMHAAIGTALGGVCTIVGEPQNLLIAEKAGWEFVEFFLRMAPVSMPVLVVGVITCVLLEQTKKFGYGAELPDPVRQVLTAYDQAATESRSNRQRAILVTQAAVAIFLAVGLMFHLAEVGIIGLSVIVLATAFAGITEEHRLGHAFEEALPFTALLVVFFAIVAVIETNHLFQPVIDYVLSQSRAAQPATFFLANGVLSIISDNVFVATVYINQLTEALNTGVIDRQQFDLGAIAINTGTNIPSVGTPNGQAAFLFLLTSALAPLIRLSYGTMVVMALPYTITMTTTGLLAVIYLL